MNRVLVTGGLGFIGSNLVDKLVSEGMDVLVIDNLQSGDKSYANINAQYDYFNLLDKDKLQKIVFDFKPVFVFHLAALPRIQPSFDNPIEYDDANVRITLNLINCLKGCNIEALIYSSSSSCYGDPDSFPTSELCPINPLSPYALQKYTSERYIHILGERYGIPVASLRYFNVYGPRSFNLKNSLNAYSSVIGIFNNQRKNGKALTVTGRGLQERDFVHVSDVADANILLAKKISEVNGEVFNVGMGAVISVMNLADIFGGNIEFIDHREGEAQITHADNTKLVKLGWSPKIQLEYAIDHHLI